ncbi:TolB family protein [Shewanella waksmanii]|uniref:TolB family protein n=1 Tax=Shewanella waksmanii TaxID=213783 RepID=UPI003734F150
MSLLSRQVASLNSLLSRLVTIAVALILPLSHAQADGYDIYLYSLTAPTADQPNWEVSQEPTAITQRAGYDNQASFSPDSQAVVFASNRGNSDGFTDIYQYEIATGKHTQLTDTANRGEFSPQWNQDQLTYVVEQGIPHQSVWQQGPNQAETRLINSFIPAGYYAHNPKLGTLIWARYAYSLYFEPTNEQADERHFVVSNAGRSIHAMPNGQQFSYLHKQTDGDWVIKAFDPLKQSHQDIIALTGGSEDYAWSQNGWLFNMYNNELRVAQYQGMPLSQWQTLAQLTPPTAKHHTPSRLSISPNGQYLTVVWHRHATNHQQ